MYLVYWLVFLLDELNKLFVKDIGAPMGRDGEEVLDKQTKVIKLKKQDQRGKKLIEWSWAHSSGILQNPITIAVIHVCSKWFFVGLFSSGRIFTVFLFIQLPYLLEKAPPPNKRRT